MNDLHRQLDQEVQSHQKSKDTIIELTRRANTQKQELAATQAKLACAETKLSKSCKEHLLIVLALSIVTVSIIVVGMRGDA